MGFFYNNPFFELPLNKSEKIIFRSPFSFEMSFRKKSAVIKASPDAVCLSCCNPKHVNTFFLRLK